MSNLEPYFIYTLHLPGWDLVRTMRLGLGAASRLKSVIAGGSDSRMDFFVLKSEIAISVVFENAEI